MNYTWEDFEEIFGVDLHGQDQLGSYYTLVIELTIALPQKIPTYRNMSLIEKIQVYKDLYNNYKAEYKATDGCYEIEYHDNGQPHLHGWLSVRLHPNTYQYDTEELLRMFAKSIFLQLPRSCYKQFAKADVNAHLKRFKSPAVTLNLKHVLAKEWVNYINKNVRPE